MKYIMCSRTFPAGHPRKGEPTFFVEQILNAILPRGVNGIVDRNGISPAILPLINDFVLLDGRTEKRHTIRPGNRFKPGDMVSLRVWSDKPYRSKQIEFAQVEVKKVWEIEISAFWFINNSILEHEKVIELAKNDGLEYDDFISWFNIHPKKNNEVFRGQIICWSNEVNY